MADLADSSDLFSLTGKVAVVIGGTGVLGGEFCRTLARAGAAVAVLGRSEEKAQNLVAELEESGASALGIALDVTNRERLVAAREEILRRWEHVDVLVNAAGINSATPFFEVSEEEWHAILDTDLTAVFLACQVFGRVMVDSDRGGSIINISSASSGPPLSRVFSYGVAKAGVNNLTQYLAREFAPAGIRVNALVPGFFPAEQNRKILAPERIESILRHTPMARLGESHELAGTLLWLASERASGFVTGTIVHVDGGFSAVTI